MAVHWRLEGLSWQARGQLKAWRRFLWSHQSRAYPRDDRGLVRLHIGCGDIDAPGFVNVDARAKPHVHIVSRSLFDLRAVPDCAASLVYMCHVLEHVPYAEVFRVLKEMRRVLAPGGTVRISVPDFDLLLNIYESNDREPEAILGPLMGGQDYPFNFHYTIFTAASLKSALANAGFSDVKPWDPRHFISHSIEDWSGRPVVVRGTAYPVSLNLEATVPSVQ